MNMSRRFYRGVWLVSMTVCAAGAHGQVDRGSAPGGTAPARSVLRIATSKDGATFTDTGRVFLRNAAAPDLLRLPDGTLLAVFDYGGDGGRDTVMAVSRSADQGKTWSPLATVRLRSLTNQRLHGSHGDLVLTPERVLHLYYKAEHGPRDKGKREVRRRRTTIRSALTDDGLNFVVDARPVTRLRGDRDVHPTAAWVDDRVVLYLDEPLSRAANEPNSPDGESESRAGQDESAEPTSANPDLSPHRPLFSYAHNGRHFVRPVPLDEMNAAFVGCVMAQGEGLRAFLLTADGIRMWRSRDGTRWSVGDGVLMPDARDAAVVRLDDGSYFMIYERPFGEDSEEESQAVDDGALARNKVRDTWVAKEPSTDAADEGTLVLLDESDEVDEELQDSMGEDAAGGVDEDALGEAAGSAGEAMAGDVPLDGQMDPADAEDGEEFADAPPPEGDAMADAPYSEAWYGPWEEWRSWDIWPEREELGFAPRPDFLEKVSYMDWYCDLVCDKVPENAYDAYMQFMPSPFDPDFDESQWPAFHDMFNNAEGNEPPRPWDPADHPEWDESLRNVQDLMDAFRDATRVEGYSSPNRVLPDYVGDPPGGENLLMGLVLPHLRYHRQLSRATLADAWRKVEGRVSPTRMLDAWETALRGANHLSEGATLIEDLVGIAERNLLYRNAQWALKREVFSGDDLADAFDTFRKFDQGRTDPLKAVKGEHAFAMDTVQYIFAPPAPGKPPQVHLDRARAIAGQIENGAEKLVDGLAGMSQADIRDVIDDFDLHYRELAEQMSIGYPHVRAADIHETTEISREQSPVAEMLIPDLTKIHQIRARAEAARRATQLTYATRLFKERHGRWPESLDELPEEIGREVRIDPFTGGYFGYRVDADGPRIYSAGENGVDDGGIHSPQWYDPNGDNSGPDDYVFWPPQD